MTAPLIPLDQIPEAWNNVIALLLGMGFGFTLESSGFSSSRKIMGTFFGYDFVVLKVFFTAAITAMTGIIYFDYMGWMDASLLYINPYYVYSAILGGLIMGAGFSIGGFCPGTSFCGAAIGKLDALVFTIGLFLGVLVFSEMYGLFEGIYNSHNMGGSMIYDLIGMKESVFAALLIFAAIAMFIGSSWIEKKVQKVNY
ncbi:MAG TPA: YeeE/YedE thiosulfate transporter family protein [Lentimicrobium sp.]|nr:YeeE/YedE thiosulfate transporter family protein [Lentimicrobium sp.]